MRLTFSKGIPVGEKGWLPSDLLEGVKSLWDTRGRCGTGGNRPKLEFIEIKGKLSVRTTKRVLGFRGGF